MSAILRPWIPLMLLLAAWTPAAALQARAADQLVGAGPSRSAAIQALDLGSLSAAPPQSVGAGAHLGTAIDTSLLSSSRGRGVSTIQSATNRGIPGWLTPLMSALVPGAGQFAQGEDRFAAYLAIESYAWIRFLRHQSDGKQDRSYYRELAATVARSLFSSEAPVGDFEYYERMEAFIESGTFDMMDDEALQPETDESTFNGSLWRRARETFFADLNDPPPVNSPNYQRALLYYSQRAVTNEFRWSWRNAQLEHDLYKRTIASSNNAFRRSVQDLAVIIGNHVLSTVDAFITLRIRQVRDGDRDPVEVFATVPVRLDR